MDPADLDSFTYDGRGQNRPFRNPRNPLQFHVEPLQAL